MDLLDGARDDAAHGASTDSLHGMGLARPGLAVREETYVISVERRLDELRDLGEHRFLPLPRREAFVVMKCVGYFRQRLCTRDQKKKEE